MIYFARLQTGEIKIGTTVWLPARLAMHDMEGRYGRNLIVIAVKEGGRDVEKQLHRKFAHLSINVRHCRTYGPVEVFRPEKELLSYIARHCRQPDLLDLLHEAPEMVHFPRSKPRVTLAPFMLTKGPKPKGAK
jgi:Meiotically up-regulated gene 113